jgi:hypothetical protein
MSLTAKPPENGDDVFVDVEGADEQHHVQRVNPPDRIGCAFQCMDCNQVFPNFTAFAYTGCD